MPSSAANRWQKKYTKTPLTTAQQVDLLRQRGLIIDDPGRAEYYLNRISYYRLSGYALPFEKSANPGQRSHEFKPDTPFETILDLYVFDRKLRTLVMDAMERVEVAPSSQSEHGEVTPSFSSRLVISSVTHRDWPVAVITV